MVIWSIFTPKLRIYSYLGHAFLCHILLFAICVKALSVSKIPRCRKAWCRHHGLPRIKTKVRIQQDEPHAYAHLLPWSKLLCRLPSKLTEVLLLLKSSSLWLYWWSLLMPKSSAFIISLRLIFVPVASTAPPFAFNENLSKNYTAILSALVQTGIWSNLDVWQDWDRVHPRLEAYIYEARNVANDTNSPERRFMNPMVGENTFPLRRIFDNPHPLSADNVHGADNASKANPTNALEKMAEIKLREKYSGIKATARVISAARQTLTVPNFLIMLLQSTTPPTAINITAPSKYVAWESGNFSAYLIKNVIKASTKLIAAL